MSQHEHSKQPALDSRSLKVLDAIFGLRQLEVVPTTGQMVERSQLDWDEVERAIKLLSDYGLIQVNTLRLSFVGLGIAAARKRKQEKKVWGSRALPWRTTSFMGRKLNPDPRAPFSSDKETAVESDGPANGPGQDASRYRAAS